MFRCGEKRDSPMVYDDCPPPLHELGLILWKKCANYEKGIEIDLRSIWRIGEEAPLNIGS